MAGEEISNSDWQQLREEMTRSCRVETQYDKLKRKLAENPFPIVGCAATALALTLGLWSFKNGKTRRSQHLMRARILAQGFTVGALVYSVLVNGKKAKEEEEVDVQEFRPRQNYLVKTIPN